MPTLTAYHLRFELAVETAMELDQHQGAALRGMLFNALRGPQFNPALGFCTQRHLKTCAECALVAACPVAGLVATLNPEAERGQDTPRPYAIVPPPEVKTRYEPGEVLTFGLTLFGNALNLFPYVVMALRQAGPGGLGKALPQPNGRLRRGYFSAQAAYEVNLLTGEAQDVLRPGSNLVQRPGLPVTHEQVVEMSRELLNPASPRAANGRHGHATYQGEVSQGPLELTLSFKTPTRIIEQGQLLKEPVFSPIFHRLLDRLMQLDREYGGLRQAQDTDEPDDAPDKKSLLVLADQVELVADQTRWQEVWSYSARQERRTPIGGLLGQATYRARREVWATLLPYLLWGGIIHVGKNAVKGDGVIAVNRKLVVVHSYQPAIIR